MSHSELLFDDKQSPDSALGTMQENTPEEELSNDQLSHLLAKENESILNNTGTSSVDSEMNCQESQTHETIVEDVSEDEEYDENVDVVAASMQFPINPSGVRKVPFNLDVSILEAEVSKTETTGVSVSIDMLQQKEALKQNSVTSTPDTHIQEEKPEIVQNGFESDGATNSVEDAIEMTIKEPAEEDENWELPSTVTVLYHPDGGKVYLVGTAHFSKESQDDVVKTIQITKPDFLVLELCKSRTAVLELDEETILRESKSLDLSKMRMVMRQHGKVQGILYLLFLSVSAHITKQLNMAPGGEFRVAIHEARRSCPKCVIQLGDRPIHITLGRALASLSVWQKLKLIFYIIASKGPISKEEVEKCKKKDFIEEMFAEMTGQFPGISRVFVKERDIFLTKSLHLAADSKVYRIASRTSSNNPRIVVGVVGMGHVAGIVDAWDEICERDISEIMIIPPPRLSDRVALFTIRASAFGLVGFGVYKCLPSLAKDFLKSSITSSFSAIESQLTKIRK